MKKVAHLSPFGDAYRMNAILGDVTSAEVLAAYSMRSTNRTESDRRIRNALNALIIALKKRIQDVMDKKEIFRSKGDKEAVRMCRDIIGGYGQSLVFIYDLYDQVASLHDKAQILGGHYHRCRKVAAEIGDEGMLHLVSSGCEEIGKGPWISGGRDMPLFEAQQAIFMAMLRNNSPFKMAARKAFQECFNVEFVPMPEPPKPDLRIVE